MPKTATRFRQTVKMFFEGFTISSDALNDWNVTVRIERNSRETFTSWEGANQICRNKMGIVKGCD
jgi:hypothetical protein